MNKPANLRTVEDALKELPDTKPNIAQRLNAVMAEVDYVHKEKPKSGMQYSYVSHDAVTKLVRPLLQRHGVVYYPRDLDARQSGNRTEAVFTVRFENIDDRTDYIDVATFGYGVDGQDKGPGKAMSYGVKYALLKALGLETGDDPEREQGPESDYRPDLVPGTITQKQFEELEALRVKAGVSEERFNKRFQVESIALLPADKFAEAKEALANRVKEPVNA